MAEAVIRDARPADLPALVGIYAQHVLHGLGTWEFTPPDEAEMARRVAAVVDRGLPWLVGECGQQVIGFAYAGPYRLRPGWAYAVEDSIYLDPAACGQGLGTRLLRALLSRLEASGLRRVFAVIGDSANEASRRLHLRCGFREIGVLERAGWKQGRWVDSVLAQRDLGLDVDAPPAGPGWMGAGP